ncbi:MAG: ABC transporter permease subunit [Lachnospiraceae bacterium]|nr:ABC transporter permease subunit [Lachnospiraceae bacterium]
MENFITKPDNIPWSARMGNSRLEEAFLPQWRKRMLCFLLFPFIPVAVFFILVGIFKVPILFIAFIIALVLGIFGSTLSVYLRITELDRISVNGELISYTGDKRETFLYCLKTRLLNLVTLGIYWLGGFDARAMNKARYSRTTRTDEVSNQKRSGFTGKILHIIFPKLLVTSVPIILMIGTHLIPIRERSELFWTELARAGTRLFPPNMDLWGLTKALARNGVSAFSNQHYYNEVTTLLMTGILVFVACSLLIPLYRYKMLKWEIDGTAIDGYQLRFTAAYNKYLGNVYLGLVMIYVPVVLIITLMVNKAKIIPSVYHLLIIALYILLLAIFGFVSYLAAKFRIQNTEILAPTSRQIPWESYMVTEEALNLSLVESEREVFCEAQRRKFANYMRRHWTLYLLLVLPVIYLIVFRYVPMLFIQIGFKQNNIVVPISDVSWAREYGFGWLLDAFKTRDFRLALRNTLMLNGLDLVLGFPAPIILAILLNELAFKKYKRVAQTVYYMPNFLSWVIISSLAIQLFNGTDGLINQWLNNMGSSGIRPFEQNGQWVAMYVLLGIWQSAGWGTIIYLAAIAGINPEYYEAASIDGASRWQKIWHITLTGLRPTIIILLIMRLGSIVGSDFERPFALRNPLITEVSDVLSIFIYQRGIRGMQFPLTAAVGIFQSVICLIFLFTANSLAKKVGERGVL